MKYKFLLPALMFLYFAAGATLFPLFTIYLSQYFSTNIIGILMAITPFCMVIFQPIWGKMATRFGIKRIIIFTLICTMLSATGLIFSRSFYQFFIVLTIYSIFSVAILPLIDTLILSVSSAQYGGIRLWGSVGYGAAVYLSSIFKRYTLGFWSFVIHIILLLITLIIIFKIPYTQSSKETSIATKLPLTNYKFVIVLFSSFLTGISRVACDTYFPVGLSKLHASDSLLGSSWILTIIPEVIIFLILDKLNAKVPSRWIMMAGIAIYAVRTLILSIFPVLWIWVATQPLLSFAFCLWNYGTLKTVNNTLDEKQKALGITVLWSVTQGIGGVVGNLLSGYIINIYGFFTLFGIVSGLCTFALLLNCFSGDKKTNAVSLKSI